MRVLIGCESSGTVRDSFLRGGHDAMSCDLKDTEKPGPHYKGDLFDVIDYPWDIAIVHIPCTNTSVSGARWFKDKRMDGRQQASVSLFLKAWKACEHIPKVAFEHPVSIISTLFRKPDQTIQPHQFWAGEHGKGEVKATCLWLKGLPKLVPTTPDEPGRVQAVWLMGPSETRATDRSRTNPGTADAMVEQWGQKYPATHDPFTQWPLATMIPDFALGPR
jgi:hypothetical protein